MDAVEFVAFAGRVVTMGKAGARSAVSRAYYGVFNLAIEVLEELATAPPKNGQGHHFAPIYLESSGHPEAVAAAGLLADLHSERIKADYRIENANVETQQFAMAGVETATTIQAHLEEFRKQCSNDASARQSLQHGIAKTIAIYKTR